MSTWEERAAEFYEQNPHIYEAFASYADAIWATGRRKIASRMIWDRLRWDAATSTTGDIFKLNNNYETFFAKKYTDHHPDRSGFFSKRTKKAA
jgi:hypothetical protein